MKKSSYFTFSIILFLSVLPVLCSCNGNTVPSKAATVPLAAPSPTASTGFNVTVNRVDEDFPNSIKFYLEVLDASSITAVVLEYQVNKTTKSPEITRVEQQFTSGQQLNISWAWEMKKSGSIPPGALLTWDWKLTDKNGKIYTTPSKDFNYADTRFTWKLKSTKLLDIYWSNQSESIIDTMIAGLEAKLATIKLPANFPQKPRIFLYSSTEEIKGAVLFQPDWIGALAYYDYNIILIPCSIELLSWCSRALAHEVTHLIVGKYVFGPFGNLPTWLNEGLALYSEGDMSDSDQQALKTAISGGGRTISIRSLAGSFPADDEAAELAYAESGSIVRYLISTGGWEKMQNLLTTFKEGSTADKAIKAVYGLDITGLEKQWLEWAKVQ